MSETIERCQGGTATALVRALGEAGGMHRTGPNWSDGNFSAKLAAVQRIEAHQLAVEIARVAADSKAQDVVGLDLRGISPVTDYTIICTGTSDRQMRALADQVREYGRTVGEKPYGFCGYDSATWIILDYVDVVLHIFAKPCRTYYDLELLWGDAPVLDWARPETA